MSYNTRYQKACRDTAPTGAWRVWEQNKAEYKKDLVNIYQNAAWLLAKMKLHWYYSRTNLALKPHLQYWLDMVRVDGMQKVQFIRKFAPFFDVEIKLRWKELENVLKQIHVYLGKFISLYQ
jgi:hypothetical protein